MQGPPKDIFPHVRDFCQSVSPHSEPFFIDTTPVKNSVANWCTSVVEQQIKEFGGKSIFGWRIWEWYGIMIEAEFHVIWQSPQGDLRDITPSTQAFKHTLFLPDTSLKYQNKQIDNVRRSLIKDSRVKDFIEVAEAIFEIMNRGSRAFQHGFITLSEQETTERRMLESRLTRLAIDIKNSTPERNELCRCGSGMKSKKCPCK